MKQQEYFADELGVLSPGQMQVNELYAGEVRSNTNLLSLSSNLLSLSCPYMYYFQPYHDLLL